MSSRELNPELKVPAAGLDHPTLESLCSSPCDRIHVPSMVAYCLVSSWGRATGHAAFDLRGVRGERGSIDHLKWPLHLKLPGMRKQWQAGSGGGGMVIWCFCCSAHQMGMLALACTRAKVCSTARRLNAFPNGSGFNGLVDHCRLLSWSAISPVWAPSLPSETPSIKQLPLFAPQLEPVLQGRPPSADFPLGQLLWPTISRCAVTRSIIRHRPTFHLAKL
jgi:hypothetical protein